MGYAATKNGYMRATTSAERATGWYLHRVRWEEAHGPIPAGGHIHHLDGDPRNNAIENLRLVTAAEHRRLHSNYQTDGLTKRCGCCSGVFVLDMFPRRSDAPDGVKSQCRDCYRAAGRAFMRAHRAGRAS